MQRESEEIQFAVREIHRYRYNWRIYIDIVGRYSLQIELIETDTINKKLELEQRACSEEKGR